MVLKNSLRSELKIYVCYGEREISFRYGERDVCFAPEERDVYSTPYSRAKRLRCLMCGSLRPSERLKILTSRGYASRRRRSLKPKRDRRKAIGLPHIRRQSRTLRCGRPH